MNSLGELFFKPFDIEIIEHSENENFIEGTFSIAVQESTAYSMDESTSDSDNEFLVNNFAEGLLPILIKEGIHLTERIDLATFSLADSYFEKQKYEKALEYYHISLKQARLISKHQSAVCHCKLGTVFNILKRYDESIAAYEKAVVLFKEDLGEEKHLDLANCLENLGEILHKLDRLDESASKFKEAIANYEDLCESKGMQLTNCYILFSYVLKDMKNNKEALECLDKAFNMIETEWGKEGILLLTLSILLNKIDILVNMKQYDEALKNSEIALEMQSPNLEKTIFLNRKGSIYLELEKPELALSCYQQALKIQISLEPIDEVNVFRALTLNFITVTLAHLKRFDEAQQHYEQACALINEIYVPGISSLQAVSLDGLQTDIYSTHFEYFEQLYSSSMRAGQSLQFESDSFKKTAIMEFQDLLADGSVSKKNLPRMEILNSETNDPLTLQTIKKMGIYLRNAGFLKEAEACLNFALQSNLKIYDLPNHSEIADCYANLGVVFRDRGIFEKARTSLQQAVSMRREITESFKPIKKVSKDSISFKEFSCLATSLDLFGTLLIELADFKNAEKALEEALAIRNVLFPKDHPNVILSLNSLGNLYKELGNYDESGKYYKLAYERVGANFHSLVNLGKLFLELGDSDTAMRYFKMALHRSQYNPNPNALQERQIADSVEYVGHCLGYIGKYHEAIEKQKEACKLRKSFFGDKTYQVAASLCAIGFYLHRIGAFNEELEFYEEAYEIQKLYFSEEHPVVANTLDSMGACYTKLGRYEGAEKAHQKALITRRSIFGDSHPTIALSLDHLGFCYSHLNSPEKALDSFNKAFCIREHFFENSHPLIQLSLSYIKGCTAQIAKNVDILDCRITKDEFETLVTYGLSYLEKIKDLSSVILEKNPTGFVRLRLPVPEEFSKKIETLRINFWTSQIQIKTVEAPHNHPRYFESMVIKGGYTQNLFVAAANSTDFLINRIFKGTEDKRNILHAGKISLTLDRTVTVSESDMISFPRNIIHQVLHTQPDSLSINCILKHEDNSTYYDVYLPKYNEQDPQIDRDALVADETGQILLRMKEILKAWEDKK